MGSIAGTSNLNRGLDTLSSATCHTQILKMPEVEKPNSEAQEVESNIKPGGLSFEVVLEAPKTDEQPSLKCPATPTLSAEDIQRKLREAADRRKSMEASTLEKLQEHEKKAEGVRERKATLSASDLEKEDESEP